MPRTTTVATSRTPTPTTSRGARFLAFPLTWMAIGIAVIVLVDSLLVAAGAALGTGGTVVGALAGGVVAVLVHRFVMHRFARRATPELAARGALRQGLLGSALGAAFILASVGVVALLGGFHIGWHPVDPVPTLLLAVGVNLGTAAVEEIVFRGLAFQAIEVLAGPRAGRWVALAVTAAFFGGAHLLNPGATLWSGLAIAVEAGVLTGAAFAWRRNLWFVMGIHFAWNAIEGLLGIAVSGHRDPGLFLTEASGPALLTGGAFGVEGSIVPVVISLAIAVPMIVAARREPGPRASRNSVVLPSESDFDHR